MNEPTDPDCTCPNCGDFCRGECRCWGEPEIEEPTTCQLELRPGEVRS